jgi:CxxC-x17-CxxC domain-containing protein
MKDKRHRTHCSSCNRLSAVPVNVEVIQPFFCSDCYPNLRTIRNHKSRGFIFTIEI